MPNADHPVKEMGHKPISWSDLFDQEKHEVMAG